ncbi:Putative acyl-CoA dehydrogenase FadE17 [Paraglaciecola mesophila]|uniref:Acyl-CoA dehydrogenase FadE17 n=1 Tax=Paraglaciecola mesophila TaxID=197222 RepID=A0A857JMR2_9ALTE|nr:acyl-CoA dehydrogenase family protein [Paraglaciecola mesophila]QHJ12257.1 Putative acyl-CoA dehydrogenase FadE17 [Paraglaciecola mesophila]
MDITFSAEELAFRNQVREFLAENWTEDLARRIRGEDAEFKAAQIEWQNKLNDKGWLAPGWPVEHGGVAWSVTENFIFETERSLAGAPDVVPFGLKMVAPVIYGFGNDEQKKRFLPRILKSQDWWCQGYSEPGAGSDLAALKTKAELDGDDYIVNGAKVWTTYAQYADWIFCLVRTDSSGKRQDGISFLLIDMKSPGITVNKISSIDDHHSLNEVVFDNVRVPVANRIGEQDKGWTYAKALLAHERTSIAAVADSKRRLRDLRKLLSEEISGGRPLIEDVQFQNRLSNTEIELMALEYTELRVLASTADGKGPGVESSLLKIKGTEIQQAIQQMYMDLAGYYSGVLHGDETAESIGHAFGHDARKAYMYGRAATIYGGSNEVQKNITAKYVLGL